jgi:hypothetical protein
MILMQGIYWYFDEKTPRKTKTNDEDSFNDLSFTRPQVHCYTMIHLCSSQGHRRTDGHLASNSWSLESYGTLLRRALGSTSNVANSSCNESGGEGGGCRICLISKTAL